MNEDTSLGFGVIGLGSIANHHIQAIIHSSNAHLVAVCSRKEDKLMQAKKEFGVSTYTDYIEMMQHPELDAICICTPSGFHLEPSLAAAQAGKHVFVEKPLEVDLDRSLKMITACENAGVQLECVFQNRFQPDFLKMKKAVNEGQLGKLVLGNAYIKWFRDQAYYDSTDWRGTFKGDGGAALINQSIHTIDLLLQLMGPVKSVIGRIATLAHEIEGEDLGLGILEFENGALGTIEGSTAIHQGYPEKLEIHGTLGNLILEGGRITQWQIKGQEGNSNVAPTETDSGSSDPMAIGYGLHQKQLQGFVKSILNGSKAEVDGQSALASIRVIRAIYESSESGKRVVLAT
jgi:predicted dehydrogenase